MANAIQNELPFLDYQETIAFYNEIGRSACRREDIALLGANDRFFLLTALLNRRDALHPWLFERCREVESETDFCLDLWAREHYKSTIITFAGCIQEMIVDPEITIGLFSFAKHIALKFVAQIMGELERNEELKNIYSDVFWKHPKKHAPLWSMANGIIIRRKSNPKEATLEGHGLDNQPTSRHFKLRVYDDVVTRENITNPEQIKKTTEGWELSDNLSSGEGRMWNIGTRYSFGDTWGVLLERKILKPRLYPATHNGKLDGMPVFFTKKLWEQKKRRQPTQIAAQMLQNPAAGKESSFKINDFKFWEIRPNGLNVYIMVDPSKGRSATSDRTAMAVIGVDANDNKYLLDGYRHRMNLPTRIQKLRELYVKWAAMPGTQMVLVGYEQYGMQSDIEAIKMDMERKNYLYDIKELNWPNSGDHSKKARVERIQHDLGEGRWFLPMVVWHESSGRQVKDGELAELAGPALVSVNEEHQRFDYRPVGYFDLRKQQWVEKPTKLQQQMMDIRQPWRAAQPLRRVDEDGNMYDLTRVLMEEMLFFPFAPKDDLVDCCSRIYDMEPIAAAVFEHVSGEGKEYRDI